LPECKRFPFTRSDQALAAITGAQRQEGQAMSIEQPTSKQSAQTAVMIERDEVMNNAVVELLNIAVVDKCQFCGWQDDDHARGCPVPALEEWINPTTLDDLV
jgi:hypothetical protein